MGEFKDPEHKIKSVVLSPDSSMLATIGEDGTAKLWGIGKLDELLAKGCDRVRDYLQNNPNVSESTRHLCDDYPANSINTTEIKTSISGDSKSTDNTGSSDTSQNTNPKTPTTTKTLKSSGDGVSGTNNSLQPGLSAPQNPPQTVLTYPPKTPVQHQPISRPKRTIPLRIHRSPKAQRRMRH